MNYSSFLNDDPRPLVLDTSVLINLNACTDGDRILRVIPNEIVIPQSVVRELEHETSRKNGEHSFLHKLVASGNVTLADMTEEEYALFADLTSGSRSLDDGEAATIAIATIRQTPCVVDEKKGRARATAIMNQHEPGWSLDLFRHPRVVAALGVADSIDALHLALRDGRMRIDSNHCNHVVSVIGVHRALECNSLPGYRTRKLEWEQVVNQESSCVTHSDVQP